MAYGLKSVGDGVQLGFWSGAYSTAYQDADVFPRCMEVWSWALLRSGSDPGQTL